MNNQEPHLNRQDRRIAERITPHITEEVKLRLLDVLPVNSPTTLLHRRPEEGVRGFLRTIVFGGAAAVFVAGWFEYWTLQGIVDVAPAKALLMFMWFVGQVIILDCLWKQSLKRKFIGMGISAVFFAAMLIGLHVWTMHWKGRHDITPATVSDIKSLQSSIDALPSKITLTSHSTETRVVPSSEESRKTIISTAPGFLKFKLLWWNNDSAFSPDEHLMKVNAQYLNSGNSLIHHATQFSTLYYVFLGGNDPDNPVVAARVRQKFAEDREKSVKRYSDLTPGDSLFTTLRVGPLDEQHLSDLVSGKATIFLVGHAEWQGDYLDVCTLMQTPNSITLKPDEVTWHQC